MGLIDTNMAKDASLEVLNEILLTLSELNAKAPRLDTAGRAVVNMADAGASLTLQANQTLTTLTNLTSLNGLGGGSIIVSGTQVGFAIMQQAEQEFLKNIDLI